MIFSQLRRASRAIVTRSVGRQVIYRPSYQAQRGFRSSTVLHYGNQCHRLSHSLSAQLYILLTHVTPIHNYYTPIPRITKIFLSIMVLLAVCERRLRHDFASHQLQQGMSCRLVFDSCLLWISVWRQRRCIYLPSSFFNTYLLKDWCEFASKAKKQAMLLFRNRFLIEWWLFAELATNVCNTGGWVSNLILAVVVM